VWTAPAAPRWSPRLRAAPLIEPAQRRTTRWRPVRGPRAPGTPDTANESLSWGLPPPTFARSCEQYLRVIPARVKGVLSATSAAAFVVGVSASELSSLRERGVVA
jgi:hypothetical protein